MKLIARPIDEWPDELATDRSHSRFTASWTETQQLLEREVEQLGGTEVVLQLAITERECRNDGWIRANAKPAHPGIIVSFDSRHGPLRYWTDEFAGNGYGGYLIGWQSNVRAVALGLEALRRVDRYGIARSGEQYRGWNQLPAGTPMGAAMTIDYAVELLDQHADGFIWAYDVAEEVHQAWRIAAKAAHPDAGGDPATFRRLTEARDLLLQHAT